jgi:hypothetical protein
MTIWEIFQVCAAFWPPGGRLAACFFLSAVCPKFDLARPTVGQNAQVLELYWLARWTWEETGLLADLPTALSIPRAIGTDNAQSFSS